jgi:hypothetical protein
MSLGEFEPDVWIPSSHPAARRGVIGLAELAGLDVIYGPRRASPATYDRWLQVLRTADPRFEFTDPPFRHSLPMALAFAATADRPTGVLTGPSAIAGPPPGVTRLPRPASTADMTRASIAGHPLTATAALVWHGDLPRPLQQILFDTADGVPPPAPASPEPASPLPTAPRAGTGLRGRASGRRDPGRVGTTTDSWTHPGRVMSRRWPTRIAVTGSRPKPRAHGTTTDPKATGCRHRLLGRGRFFGRGRWRPARCPGLPGWPFGPPLLRSSL